MSYFRTNKEGKFDWKEFQKHMGYSDAELEAFKKDPKKSKFAPIMADPDILNKTLVVEVVESKGCALGLKPGNRLYLKDGCSILDPERSDPWCTHAMHALYSFTAACHSLMQNGIDPNEMYWDVFACADAGPKYSWGQVKMKCFVIDERDKKK